MNKNKNASNGLDLWHGPKLGHNHSCIWVGPAMLSRKTQKAVTGDTSVQISVCSQMLGVASAARPPLTRVTVPDRQDLWLLKIARARRYRGPGLATSVCGAEGRG